MVLARGCCCVLCGAEGSIPGEGVRAHRLRRAEIKRWLQEDCCSTFLKVPFFSPIFPRIRRVQMVLGWLRPPRGSAKRGSPRLRRHAAPLHAEVAVAVRARRAAAAAVVVVFTRQRAFDPLSEGSRCLSLLALKKKSAPFASCAAFTFFRLFFSDSCRPVWGFINISVPDCRWVSRAEPANAVTGFYDDASDHRKSGGAVPCSARPAPTASAQYGAYALLRQGQLRNIVFHFFPPTVFVT